MQRIPFYDEILNYLSARPGESQTIRDIFENVGCDRKTANKCLYDMSKQNLVVKTKESNPPCWKWSAVPRWNLSLPESLGASYTAQVSFVRVRGVSIPWTLTLTAVESPHFRTVRIGMLSNNRSFRFNSEDVLSNMNNSDDFLRTYRLDHQVDLLDRSCVNDLYMKQYWRDGWVDQVAALDQQTYDYLSKIIDGVVLLPATTVAEDRTLAAAYRLERKRLDEAEAEERVENFIKSMETENSNWE